MPKLPGIEYSSQVGGSLGREDVNAPVRAARAKAQAAEAIGQVAEQYVEYKGATEYNNAMLDYEPKLAAIEDEALQRRALGDTPGDIVEWQDGEMAEARLAAADTIKTGRGHSKFNEATENLDAKTKAAWGRQAVEWNRQDYVASTVASFEEATRAENWVAATIAFEDLSAGNLVTPVALANYHTRLVQGEQIDRISSSWTGVVENMEYEGLTAQYDRINNPDNPDYVTDPVVRRTLNAGLTEDIAQQEALTLTGIIADSWPTEDELKRTGGTEKAMQALRDGLAFVHERRDQTVFEKTGMTEDQYKVVEGNYRDVFRRYEAQAASLRASNKTAFNAQSGIPYGHYDKDVNKQWKNLIQRPDGTVPQFHELLQEIGAEGVFDLISSGMGKLPSDVFGSIQTIMTQQNHTKEERDLAMELTAKLYREEPSFFNVGKPNNQEVKYLKDMAKIGLLTNDIELTAQIMSAATSVASPDQVEAATAIISSDAFGDTVTVKKTEDLMNRFQEDTLRNIFLDPTIKDKIQKDVGLLTEKVLWMFTDEGTTAAESLQQAHAFAVVQVSDTLGEDRTSGTNVLSLNSPLKLVYSKEGFVVRGGEWERKQAQEVWASQYGPDADVTVEFTGVYDSSGAAVFTSIVKSAEGLKQFKPFTYNYEKTPEAEKQRKEEEGSIKKAKNRAAFELRVADMVSKLASPEKIDWTAPNAHQYYMIARRRERLINRQDDKIRRDNAYANQKAAIDAQKPMIFPQMGSKPGQKEREFWRERGQRYRSEGAEADEFYKQLATEYPGEYAAATEEKSKEWYSPGIAEAMGKGSEYFYPEE